MCPKFDGDNKLKKRRVIEEKKEEREKKLKVEGKVSANSWRLPFTLPQSHILSHSVPRIGPLSLPLHLWSVQGHSAIQDGARLLVLSAIPGNLNRNSGH